MNEPHRTTDVRTREVVAVHCLGEAVAIVAKDKIIVVRRKS